MSTLRRLGNSKAEQTAAKLQQYAAQVLLSSVELSFTHHVKHFCCLKESVAQMEREFALNLAQTQGAFLTSISGIGIVLAAGTTAEIGNPVAQKIENNLVFDTSADRMAPR